MTSVAEEGQPAPLNLRSFHDPIGTEPLRAVGVLDAISKGGHGGSRASKKSSSFGGLVNDVRHHKSGDDTE